MATLTLKAVSVESQLPPLIDTTLSSSAIAIQNFDAGSYPSGIVSKRAYQTRAFNLFDFTTNIYPPSEDYLNLSNIQGILVTGLGYYGPTNNEIAVTSFPYLKTFFSSTPLLVANTYFTKAQLVYSFAPLTGPLIETFDIQMADCIYIKYKIKYNDNSYSPEIKLKAYRGTNTLTYLRFTEVCNIQVTPDTVNIISLSNIQGLNVSKNRTLEQIISTSSSKLTTLYPEILEQGTSFIPRIYFSNSTFTDDYSNLVTIDSRLTYSGKPIYEGQGIPISGIYNGLLQFNTVGLTATQISNYKFYVIYEGFASGDAFVRSV